MTPDTIIIGAGPAGLAVAACLKRAAVPALILEQSDKVGATWHRHYDRLHLHTDKAHSALPFVPFPRDYPRYPSRLQVIAYLEAYARAFQLEIRFGQEVVAADVDGRHARVGRLEADPVALGGGISLQRYITPSGFEYEAYRGGSLPTNPICRAGHILEIALD